MQAAENNDVRGYSFRHIISLLALLFWLGHTMDIHLCLLQPILESYSKLSMRAQFSGWDTDVDYFDHRLLRKIFELADVLMANVPVPLPAEPLPPSAEDREILVITDASASGWAALVHIIFSGETFCLRRRWPDNNTQQYHLSTVAEPAAAAAALQWVFTEFGTQRKIALVTDHSPIVEGQARWWSKNAGFSQNVWLNETFKAMQCGDVEAWHIPGVLNPADAPSRNPPRGCSLVVTSVTGHFCMPVPLSSCSHPFVGCGGAVRDVPVMMG